MKQFTRIIASFFLVGLFFILFVRSSKAQEILQPISEKTNMEHGTNNIEQIFNNLQPTTYNQQPTTYFPSITFGQILDGSYQTIIEEKQKQKEQADSAKIQNMLAKLEQAYNDSINNNQPANNKMVLGEMEEISDTPLATDNLEPITNNQSPAPTSSVSSLIANISDLVYQGQKTNNEQITKNEISQQSHETADANVGNPKKSWFTIALLGDSMIDTLQRDLPQLQTLLKNTYPDYTFNLINYGQGATDMESGLHRLTDKTVYLGIDYPPLLSYRPDILVVESFAYNPWSWEKYDLDRQWLTIAKIIDVVKVQSPDTKIVFAATIAPNTNIFGDGALNWTPTDKWIKASTIKLYLQNMVNFATSQNYPLADAYHASMDGNGEGLAQYINGGDHLHPSAEGGMLFSQKIVEVIKTQKLIQ